MLFKNYDLISSVENKRSCFEKRISVFFSLYNGIQWAPVLFGFHHTSKYHLLCFTKRHVVEKIMTLWFSFLVDSSSESDHLYKILRVKSSNATINVEWASWKKMLSSIKASVNHHKAEYQSNPATCVLGPQRRINDERCVSSICFTFNQACCYSPESVDDGGRIKSFPWHVDCSSPQKQTINRKDTWRQAFLCTDII